MQLSKEQREEQGFRARIDKHKKVLMQIMEAEKQGFDVERYLEDYLKGEAKDREHYRIRKVEAKATEF